MCTIPLRSYIGLAFEFLCPPVDVLRERKSNFHADILLIAGKGHGCAMMIDAPQQSLLTSASQIF